MERKYENLKHRSFELSIIFLCVITVRNERMVILTLKKCISLLKETYFLRFSGVITVASKYVISLVKREEVQAATGSALFIPLKRSFAVDLDVRS